jgi:hypothetical protein
MLVFFPRGLKDFKKGKNQIIIRKKIKVQGFYKSSYESIFSIKKFSFLFSC